MEQTLLEEVYLRPCSEGLGGTIGWRMGGSGSPCAGGLWGTPPELCGTWQEEQSVTGLRISASVSVSERRW